jgi:PAS domain S-box-containing protein
MATSPDYLRLASNSARALAETVLDGLTDPVLVVDARHKHLPIVLVNAAARKALSPADDCNALIESALLRRLTPTSVGALEAALADLGAGRAIDLNWLLDDGPRPFATELKPLPSSPAQRLVMLQLRPRAQPAHATPSDAENRKLLALTEHARDIITIADRHGTLQYVSGGVRNSLGYTSGERESNGLFDYVHPEDAVELRARFQELVDGKAQSCCREFRVKHKDGSYRWLESSFISALDNPLIGGVLINSRDVTERKTAERKLAQREEVFRLAADAVEGMIYEWDIVGGSVHRSRGMLEVLGLEPDDMDPGVDGWRSRIHPGDLDVATRIVNLALLNGRGWTTSYRMRDARGRYRSLLERGLIQRNGRGDPTRVIGCCVDVSEMRRIGDLLNETQRAANIGGWEYSHVTQELTWTDEMYRIYEASPRDFAVSWQSMLARCTPESLQRFQEACDRARTAGGQIDQELEITTLKSRRIWVRLIAHLEMLDGRPLRACGSVQDIQAQKLARIALESSTGWLRLSMNMAHMHAWRWDRARDAFEFAIADGRRLPTAFPNMRRMLMRVHPADRLLVSAAIDEAFERGAEVQREFRLEARSGRYRWYAAIARPLFDERGGTRGLVGVIQDVTARRDSEMRLRRSEELLRVTTANTADTLILVDTDLRVRFINKSMEGRGPQQIIGRDIVGLLPPAARSGVLEKLGHLLSTGEAIAYEFKSGQGQDTRYFESRAVLVRDEGIGTCISLSMCDVTERKRLEREIIEVSGRERRRIGRDLHDGLGQELTGIALMLRGLSSKIRTSCPEAIDWVDEIVSLVNQSIENARGLARGLLPVRTETGGLLFALRELAERSRDLYGLEVNFRSKVWPALTLDETDSSHLYRIAQEALTNASRHGHATEVEIFLRVSPRTFLLRISDNGEGFHPATSPYTGMGLKIMRYRAGRIGAKFEISPNEPRGTVVLVSGEQPPMTSDGSSARLSKESK